MNRVAKLFVSSFPGAFVTLALTLFVLAARPTLPPVTPLQFISGCLVLSGVPSIIYSAVFAAVHWLRRPNWGSSVGLGLVIGVLAGCLFTIAVNGPEVGAWLKAPIFFGLFGLVWGAAAYATSLLFGPGRY